LLLEGHFASVWVEGEISNLTRHRSGHWYFSLKDAQSQIPAVMFRGANRRVKFTPENGMLVTVTGSVQIYAPQGKYQVLCERIEPSGIGALQMAFDQLKKKLAEEGLFDAERKQALPAFPRVVGVVTSPSGAAIRDIINVLYRRFPKIRLVLNPAPVQGVGAAEKIAQAIHECNSVNREHAEDARGQPWQFDVLIVGRGGGSMEDLWAFNEEVVARAIAGSRIPIIAAVGHETDWTIADFVADARAPTPSAAAELVIESRAVWLGRIIDARRRVERVLTHGLERWRARVTSARTHYALREPARLVDSYRQRADELNQQMQIHVRDLVREQRERVTRARRVLRSAGAIFGNLVRQYGRQLALQRAGLERLTATALVRRRDRIAALCGALEALGPAAVLQRGYTVTRDAATGAVRTRTGEIKPGQRLTTEFRDGKVESQVTNVSPAEETAAEGGDHGQA
jgi:exodeoxyribonuclease VII large subunit